MTQAFTFIRQVFLTLALLFSMLLMPAGGEPFAAKDPENARLVFNAVSDTHVETNNPDSYANFKAVLCGMKANADADAHIFVGDNTMNGQLLENTLFFAPVGSILSGKTTFVTIGNHDTGNGEGDYDALLKRYMNKHNLYLKNKIDEPYYCRVVEDCYLIFLSGHDTDLGVLVDDAQYTWLTGVLNEAAESGNPIFVFSHHPIGYLHDEAGHSVAELLWGYDDVFCINGHTHWSYMTYESGGLPAVNLPRVTETVDYEAGVGVVAEVYEDEVLFREYNFITGEVLSETAFAIG